MQLPCKGLAEADQGMLSNLLCANEHKQHPSGRVSVIPMVLQQISLAGEHPTGLLNLWNLSSQEEDNRKLWLWE